MENISLHLIYMMARLPHQLFQPFLAYVEFWGEFATKVSLEAYLPVKILLGAYLPTIPSVKS